MRFKMTILAACACALAASGGSAFADNDDRKRHSSSHHSSANCNSTHSHGGLTVVGVTADSRIVCFKEESPGSAKTIGKLTGLTTDTKLVGIDYRPATGADGDHGDLYGLGDAGGIYTVSDATGKATLKSRMDVALSGTAFGTDFNPTVDRLRVISDTGQNLRVNVDTGATLTDGGLSYPPATTAATGVVGAAYTNNDGDATTATTLFDIDSATDQIALQSPANSGQLAATGKLTVDTGTAVGADIYSWVRDGVTMKNEGLVSLSANGKTALFTVDLLQGKARAGGLFSAKNQVTGIAIPLNQK